MFGLMALTIAGDLVSPKPLSCQRHEQVVAAVSACNQFNISLTARGRGTDTTGSVIPVPGGLVMSMERNYSIST